MQLFAVSDSDQVVGWCDIVRNNREGFRHVGYLGMGLLPDYRGRGLGKRLARATIDAARALYGQLGFMVEGVKRRARKLDGRYDDDVFMAMLAPV